MSPISNLRFNEYVVQVQNQLSIFFLYIILALTVLGIAFFSFHLYSYDLRVPFSYSGDSVVILMYIKSLIQDGWPTTISHLSAPFSYSGAAFPILTSVDWLVIKILSIFTKEPGYLLNGFWLLTLVFSAWSAAYASYQLGLSRVLSFLSGVLYAFLPFALLRNVSHMNLVYYFVPLLCLLAIIIAGGGTGIRQLKQATIVGLIACVLQGFNYVYYSFFAVLLFGFASLISYKRGGGFRQMKLPAFAIMIITLSTAMNMVPAMLSWHENGTPPGMNYKSVAEAEYYGAKLRKMLAPHPDNSIKVLAKWGQKDISVKFPNENENATARLGIYGAFGLLFLLAVSLQVVKSEIVVLPILSNLSLFTFLVITVGGLGTILNLLTVPDIRCYNRFSVFLGFLSIVATSLYVGEMYRKITSKIREILFSIFLFFIVLISFHDQLLDSKRIVNRQKTDTALATHDREFVTNIEKMFGGDSKVFQFPITPFPLDSGLNKMELYEHGKPFIWSNHLRWSWPSFSERHLAWQDKITVLKNESLMRYLVLSGFDLVWVNRYAYEDNGKELISMLTSNGAKEQLIGSSSRYAILDLRDYKKQLTKSIGQIQFEAASQAILNAYTIGWERGFYDEEKNSEGHKFRWVKDKAVLSIRNYSELPLNVCVAFNVASPLEGHVKIDGSGSPIEIDTSTAPKSIRFPLTLEPSDAKELRFSTDLRRLNAPEDSRELYFYVIDFSTKILNNNTIKCGNN